MNYYSLISSMNRVVSSTLLNSLVSVYKAESNANDSLGTYNGSALGGVTYTTGKSGNAFTFNGTTAYVDMGDVMDIGTNSWTYSFWFNPTQAFSTSVLFGKTIAAGVRGRVIGVLESYKLQIIFDADATNVIVVETPASTIAINNWYHAVIQIDRTDKIKLYLNGSAVTLTTTSGTNNLAPYSATNYNTNNPFRIGAGTSADNTTPSTFYSGKIDEFNLWNRVLTPTEVTELYKCSFGNFYPFTVTPSLDSDACAFVASASITNTTQQNAINQLVLDLKTASIWTKMKAIYPFVGGTASQHKFNLKDPRDLDVAYRLNFVNGWTHSVTGALPSGTDGYANTFLQPSSTGIYPDQYSSHFSLYTNTNTFPATSTLDFIGVYSLNPSRLFQLGYYTDGSNVKNHAIGLGGDMGMLDSSITTAKGFILGSRTNTNSLKLYKNNSLIQTNTATVSSTLPTSNIYLGARNGGGTVDVYSKLNHQFVTIGDGLTDTEALALYTAVQAFNTTLGRPY